MSEENTTQAPGLILPDDAVTAERVSATDRLLSFDADGNPVTATAEQVKTYAAEGLATTEAMTAALAGKAPLLDYTSLDEQLVPGEFWICDNLKKQVYTRTFVLTGQVTAGGFSLFQRVSIGATSILSVVGYSEETHALDGITRIMPYTSSILYKNGGLWGFIDLVKDFGTGLMVGSLATITANVKYTK